MKKHIFLYTFLLTTKLFSQHTGIVLENMDAKIDPKTDFYNYCNGIWQKNFQLPESDARFGSFNEIHNSNLKRIKSILEDISKNTSAPVSSDTQKMRDFYNTAMDTVKANQLRAKPIRPQLAKIDSISSINDLMALKSEFDFIGIDLFFSLSVSPDLKNSKKNVMYINQSGYGMGDRDYYQENRFDKVRKQYLSYIESLFDLILVPKEEAAIITEDVFTIELNLTNKALTRTQLRDIKSQYNIYTPKTLHELVPSVDWNTYFKSKGIKHPDTLIVCQVAYMKEVEKLLSNSPIHMLKKYAKAQLLMNAAPYLSTKFQTVDFNFRGSTLSGTKEIKPKWERVYNAMNSNIGEMLSQVYVKKYFPAESKVKVNKLINNLILAYRQRIATRDWMSDETKKQAYKKLNLMVKKVAYPDKWKSYKGLTIGTESYWDNMCRAQRFLVQENIKELKKPVDRFKWQMTPTTVNAYYDPTTNEITFPAAILQPPFYDPKADDAANYGTMGSIIGHELTHGFDDQGAQFDAKGNLKMWWTETDFANFKTRTNKVVNQYNAYIGIDTLHVNGEMTQGENIADLGGLTMSYYAYKNSLAGAKSKVISNLTGEQRFFIAWAQGWKSKVRDEELKRLLTVDYHAPAYFRAFAPLTNMKEFHEAFDVKPGDKMYLPIEKQVEIW